MRLVGKVVGYLISALGIGIAIFGLLAVADPQGAQLANDFDPFGVPPSTAQRMVHIAVGVALSALGIWLVARKPRV
ncbi:hypothetical protein OVA13_02705 [Pseudoxanthomonas sp. SL93]|uniref:hypothetical protein n=1 Tax=Pseudoxanthomonas sp. SL93 TaxID=2995142 RepID=UPI002271386E|nr:hypothetical protein [Pseudoxanthomonas sp. SL93]WAC63720.1 hypothetical protein OVA13_02705 [Pseudoxanthomonas sp. SL93]